MRPGIPKSNANEILRLSREIKLCRCEFCRPLSRRLSNRAARHIHLRGRQSDFARHGGGQNGDEGGRGGDGFAIGTNSLTAGGQGGEASQPDGRGGRGGHAYVGYDLARPGAAARPAHMRWPYYEPITEAGRGGDAPDTPQYKVRRLIVEQIKKKYFAQHGLPFDEVWWDREIVPLTWINEQIGADGHLWRATIVDDEYEFSVGE